MTFKRPFKIPSIYNNDHKDQQPYNTDFIFSKLQIIQVMKIILHNSNNFMSEIMFMISKAPKRKLSFNDGHFIA
jgi:hypothetical protein